MTITQSVRSSSKSWPKSHGPSSECSRTVDIVCTIPFLVLWKSTANVDHKTVSRIEYAKSWVTALDTFLRPWVPSEPRFPFGSSVRSETMCISEMGSSFHETDESTVFNLSTITEYFRRDQKRGRLG